MSYAGLGQLVPTATVGRSNYRRQTGDYVRVPATWAQRAANAGNRYNSPSAPLIAVDGKAGPITITALRTLSRQFSSGLPVTNDPVASRVTDNVVMPVALENALAARHVAPDPSPSSATRRTTTTTSGSSTTEPVPGATPAETPADEVILDEGSSSGIQGLIARYGIWPWAAGGAALVALGIYFVATGPGMRSNRRRVRRNSSKRKVRRNSALLTPRGMSRAWLDSGGTLHYGEWIVPARGESRFKTKAEAERAAKHFSYDGAFGTKVVKESSRSRPGSHAYQVYIRSLGKIEGLTRNMRGLRSGEFVYPSPIRSLSETEKYAQQGRRAEEEGFSGRSGVSGDDDDLPYEYRPDTSRRRRGKHRVTRNAKFRWGGTAGAGKKMWVWDWVGGGWNSGWASNKAAATRLATRMGIGTQGRVLKPTNVRIARPGEIDQLASGWD